MNKGDLWGRTPLEHACKKGHESIVVRLLKAGASVNAKNQKGETPLLKAATYGHVECCRHLLAHGANVNAAEIAQYNTSLHKAVLMGYPATVRLLLQHNVDLKLSNAENYNICHCVAASRSEQAAEACAEEIVTFLLFENPRLLRDLIRAKCNKGLTGET